MTDLAGSLGASTPADAAVAAADSAARASGVTIRQLDDLRDLVRVPVLFERIWGADGKNPPISVELLRALTKAGNYASGAFEGDDLVGACVGFFAPPTAVAMHSHIAGVDARMAGRHVGFALKLHQRAWAMLRGVEEVSWTFDPLVRRNAYFNIAKLAATPSEYLTNFYGQMHDRLNGTDETDRLLVGWLLGSPTVAAACIGSTPRPVAVDGMPAALAVGPDGAPVAQAVAAESVLVAVPADIETLRAQDPACAGEWRIAVREVLGGLLADGARIRGFDRAGWYVVDVAGPYKEDES